MARERKIYPTRMSGGRLGAAHIYQVGRFSLSAFPLMPTSPPTMFDRSRRRHTSTTIALVSSPNAATHPSNSDSASSCPRHVRTCLAGLRIAPASQLLPA